MHEFKIIHGSIKTQQGLLGSNIIDDEGNKLDVIELSEKEAKLIDPPSQPGQLIGGATLKLKSEWDAEQAGELAKSETIAKAKATTKKEGSK
jgi:hypothetical protein